MRLLPCCVLGLLLGLPATVSAAASGDDWLGPDKAKHFAACTVLAGAGYGGGALLFEAPEARWLTGAGLAMGAGLAKELYDTRPGGTGFSTKDLVWDAVGTATGLGVAFLVDHFLFGRDEAPVARTQGLRAVAPVIPGGDVELPSGAMPGSPGLGGLHGTATLISGGNGGPGDAPTRVIGRAGGPGLHAARVLDGDGATAAEHGRGGLGAALVVDGRRGDAPRLALDELHQLLPLEARVHHQHGATPAVAAGDEHGDLASRALVHAAGGHDADLLGQAPLGERALQPARQVQASAPRATAHEALAADEHLHLPLRVSRSLSAFVLHPASSTSKSRAVSLPRPSDAPLKGTRRP